MDGSGDGLAAQWHDHSRDGFPNWICRIHRDVSSDVSCHLAGSQPGDVGHGEDSPYRQNSEDEHD